MKRVLKYKLFGEDICLNLPENAEVLSVGVQNREIYIWVLVDDYFEEDTSRRFLTLATGEQTNYKGLVFIGTIHENGFVYHIFEIKG